MTPAKSWSRWTPEEDLVLCKLRAARVGYAAVALVLGRSYNATCARGRQVCAVSAWRPWSPDELTIALRMRHLKHRWSEIRDKLAAKGFPRRSISVIVRKLRPHLPLDPRVLKLWTEPELRLAQQLRADGKTWRQTAAGLQAAGYPRRSGEAVARMFIRVAAVARSES